MGRSWSPRFVEPHVTELIAQTGVALTVYPHDGGKPTTLDIHFSECR